MCLILISYRSHQYYPLLVAANRDEFFGRPTAPLAFWDDAPQVLAGRDLQQGGTWMGVTQTGRFAAITNYRDSARAPLGAPSRGWLVSNFLRGNESAHTYLDQLISNASCYNGFNLVLGDTDGLFYYSNRADKLRTLTPGVYGLSNHLLDTPWPKLERSRHMLLRLLDRQREIDSRELLALLMDRTCSPDSELPHTGVPLEWERWLSAIFVDAPDYGTRSSTTLMVNKNQAHMLEITWTNASQREFWLNWPVDKAPIQQ